jgi:hypothetical protein
MNTSIKGSVRNHFLGVFFNDVFQLQMINDLAEELPGSRPEVCSNRSDTFKSDAYLLGAMTVTP